MAGISGLSSGVDYSVLFGTSNNQQSGQDYSSILNLDLADVASVRNGSYGKLLKNYYKQDKASAASELGDTDAKLTGIKSDADKLVKAADALNDKKLYETKTVTGDDGKTKEEFADRDKLAGVVKDFVKAYNSTIDSAAESETKSVLRNGSWLAGMSRQNSNLLSTVGISISADDKLSFDEEKFKNADVTTVKDVFSGIDSYASQVSAKAGSISRATQNAGAFYNSSGNYSPQLGSIAESAMKRINGAEEEKEKTAEEGTAEGTKKILTEEDA
ncbi:MAG: flagellar filament capping protein FliD [Lachnospiraceae bacterium]|nr:flagellar filament capping protein FliD [Lachnospiraceae bacterium]